MSLRLKMLLLTILVQGLVLAVTVSFLSEQSRKVKAHRECLSALQTRIVNVDLSAICEPIIAKNHLAAAQSYSCDLALTSRPQSAYGVKAACSLPVKTIRAERDVARAEAGRLVKTLNDERLGRDAAIARAQAAAKTQAERKARAAAVVQAAPRDGDGLIRCDADCVRDRWASADTERP